MNYFACILPNFWSNGAPRLCLQCQFSPELYTLDTDFAVDRSRQSTRCPKRLCTWGSVSTTATQDASVRRALPGLIFYFFDFFCWLEILCQNIYFQILYLKIFCLKFFSTKFFSFTKFCTTIFLPKFIDLSKFFHEIFLFRVFLLIFSLKALFKIVCISLVNFLFI